MRNELVYSLRDEVYCDSRVIAHEFGKRPEHVVDKIDNLIVNLSDLDTEKSATKKTKKQDSVVSKWTTKTIKNPPIFVEKFHSYRNQDFRYFDMNKPAFTLLVMGFTGKKALRKKLQFNDAFYEMRKILVRQKQLPWQQDRKEEKSARLGLTDVVKIFVQYCEDKRSKNASRYYNTITKMIYCSLGWMKWNEKIPPRFKDMLDEISLENLATVERHVRREFLIGMENDLDYHIIYEDAKVVANQIAPTLRKTSVPSMQVKDKQIALF